MIMGKKEYIIDYIKNECDQDEQSIMRVLRLDIIMMEIDSVYMNAGHYPYQVKGRVDNLNIDLKYRYVTTDETKIEIMLIHTHTDNKEMDNEFHITLLSESTCNDFITTLGEKIILCL